MVMSPDPACLMKEMGRNLWLADSAYHKSGKPIRLLILADHVIRMAASQLGFSVTVLWAYDSPK